MFSNRIDRGVSGWGRKSLCDIPSFTLMPGLYTVKIWLDINHQEADLVNYAARVNVLESDYYGSGKAPWNGTMVLPHNWYVEEPSRLPVNR